MRRPLHQQGCDVHQVVGEHGGADQQLEALDAFGQTALHAAAAEQHGDAPLDAGPEALPLLEGGRLLIGFAFRSSRAAALRNAHRRDAAAPALRQVSFAEEAAICAVQFGGPAESLLMAAQRLADMLFVRRISPEHPILRDQAVGAFGKEDLMAELQGRAHLAALDQIGMGLEDRVNLLRGGNLLAFDYAAAGLADHPISQVTIWPMSLWRPAIARP